ncbi:hypothetical protein ABT071_36325 [Streptomyces sp. NPDC002506]|uniref:hypothetical protein n=1 Tax=Streptomyces sp. NPDC002506 TaxID=3154536 RepID=UPI00331EC65E
MWKSIGQALLWVAVAAGATGLAWWGVASALSAGDALVRPLALPSAGRPPASGPVQAPSSRPGRQPEPGGPPAGIRPSPPGTNAPATPDPPPTPPPSPLTTRRGERHQLAGGEVRIAADHRSATLVSAVPADDWRVQTWAQQGWLRVTFTRGSEASTLFCTWNGHPPSVQIDDGPRR